MVPGLEEQIMSGNDEHVIEIAECFRILFKILLTAFQASERLVKRLSQ